MITIDPKSHMPVDSITGRHLGRRIPESWIVCDGELFCRVLERVDYRREGYEGVIIYITRRRPVEFGARIDTAADQPSVYYIDPDFLQEIVL